MRAVCWLEGDRKRLRRLVEVGERRRFPPALETWSGGVRTRWVRVRVDEHGEGYYRPARAGEVQDGAE